MRQGVLVPDFLTGRMVVRFSVHEYSRKLHCGQPLEVLVDGVWQETRIGYEGGWILEGVECATIVGLRVRI